MVNTAAAVETSMKIFICSSSPSTTDSSCHRLGSRCFIRSDSIALVDIEGAVVGLQMEKKKKHRVILD